MKPELRYHELSKQVEMSSAPTSSIYLEAGDPALTEDLIVGYVTHFGNVGNNQSERVVIPCNTTGEFVREVQYIPPDGKHRALVVRDAHKTFTRSTKDVLLTTLEREKRNARLLVVLVGDQPSDEVKNWFMAERAYGIVGEPTMEKQGAWMATKTAGRWDYRDLRGALITEADGLRLMEHVGWSYTAALQAAATLQAYGQPVYSWEQQSALVPPRMGFGYADSLVFGKGLRSALRLSQGVPDHEYLKVLGLIRYYLRQFAILRAAGAETMSDRAVSLETGVHVWHWRTKYKPAYARYTQDRLRMRQGYVEEAMQAARSGATTGVLEVLAQQW